MFEGNNELACPPAPYSRFKLGKTFQNLRVSSPAPVTMFEPHGLMPRYRTRYEWPVSVVTFYIDGYFQTMI